MPTSAGRRPWWRRRCRCSPRWAWRKSASTKTSSPPPVPRRSEIMTETQENQERSVPKPVFTDAEAGAKTFPDSTKRDFNYYTPAKRKQPGYENATVGAHPAPRHYLAQGWLYGFSDGRGGYPLDWTTLKAWGSDRPEPPGLPRPGGAGEGRPARRRRQ